MANYFIRFGLNKEALHKDYERGYSFEGYCLFDSLRDAIDNFYGEETDTEEVADEFGQDNGEYAGQWGRELSGLCGFGPYESIEEAEIDARERGGYNGVEWPVVGIFTGSYAGDCGDGDVFRASELVKVVEL